MPGSPLISAAVEGIVDKAVARRLIREAGGIPGPVYDMKGKQRLRQKINAYNHAARFAPWLVLVDLDNDASCAPSLRQNWLPVSAPPSWLCFRIAVPQVEAWLLADAESLAAYLGVAKRKIPDNPEALLDPKTAMVNLARDCQRRDIQQDMVPRPSSGRKVGPAYTSRLVEYVENHWQPARAAQHADSLRRAIQCLQRLVSRWGC
jgi:hypothetical protein